jgi:ketosteroid isomerase-like protein
MRNSGGILLLAVAGFLSACNKSTPATADSATVATGASSASVDKNAARLEIVRADSAWLRHMVAKNVDSLMTYYAPDIISMSEGSKPVRGTTALRPAYTEMVKMNMRDPSISNQGVEFSDDGSMAYDHVDFSATVDGPNGKPMKWSGNALNVWRKIGGRWLMVAEISNSNQPPK